MKRFTLLLTAMLSLAGLTAQAQTNPTWEIIDTCYTDVEDQNYVNAVPADDYLSIEKSWIPSDVDDNNAKYYDTGDGVSFSNMRNGQFAVFHLNVTKAHKAQVKMQMATKESTGSVEFALFNASHELELDTEVKAAATGNWSRFQDNYFITDNEITEGEKTLVIIFHGPKYTVNVRNIIWADFGNQQTFSFYPSLVSDDNNPDAGTITVSPNSNTYVEGTVITVTATPAEGYKFINWTDADGNVVSTDATYSFAIGEDTDLDANFKKINMVNSIPGFFDTDTKIGTQGSVSTVASGRNAPRFIRNYENPQVGDTLNINEGVAVLESFRNGNTFSFQAKVDKLAKYYINFLASSKNNSQDVEFLFMNEDDTTADSVVATVPATGQWFNYTVVQAQTNVELPATVNRVKVTFLSDDDKYAANIINLSFSENAQDPTIGADGNSILEGGSTTGISAIDNSKSGIQNPDAAYNLSGQRVGNSYKGIVIRNGKKYIIK